MEINDKVLEFVFKQYFCKSVVIDWKRTYTLNNLSLGNLCKTSLFLFTISWLIVLWFIVNREQVDIN